MTPQELQSLIKVLRYMRESEHEDYEVTPEYRQNKHIYHDVRLIAQWAAYENPEIEELLEIRGDKILRRGEKN